MTAIVVGSVLGGLILGTSLVLGAKTGAPAMVLLRGLLGAKASFLPTVLNIAQCLGWAVFELLVIADRPAGPDRRKSAPLGLRADRGRHHHRPDHLAAGLHPGAAQVRVGARGHRYGRARHRPAAQPDAGHRRVLERLLAGRRRRGGTDHFLGAAGRRLLAAFPQSARAAFAGGFFGYGFTQIACLLLGVVALAQVQQDPDQIFDLFLAVPLGTAAFAVLVLRETDQSFANVYSTAMSIQNMRHAGTGEF